MATSGVNAHNANSYNLLTSLHDTVKEHDVLSKDMNNDISMKK